MFSDGIGRRNFLKKLSSAAIGALATRFLDASPSSAKTENAVNVEYRTLGRTGLKVTCVGMGVMNCSDSAVVLRAFDLGINFFDTAPSYMRGRNEEMVGKAFKGRREKVYIQTKVELGDESKMQASVEASLRRLQTDYFDILLLHGLNSAEQVSDGRLFAFMERMKKEGKARFTGFSAHSRMAPLLREAAKGKGHDVALVSYNFTHSKDLKGAVALAAKSGIGIVAMKTQAGGYKREKMGKLSPHQAALKYVLSDPNVALAVPGVTTIEQMEECAAVMGATVSQRDLHELRQYEAFLQDRICTMCGACAGICPYGVRYDQALRAVMYQDGYEDRGLAEEALAKGFAHQDLNRCARCESCSATCKRGVNIQAQVRAAQQILNG